MNIPNDCVVVKKKESVSPFSLRHWYSGRGEQKTVPLDIYQLVKDRVILVKDVHQLIHSPKTEVKTESKTESKSKKSGKRGKSKNKK
jgi:hypothetical protein